MEAGFSGKERVAALLLASGPKCGFAGKAQNARFGGV